MDDLKKFIEEQEAEAERLSDGNVFGNIQEIGERRGRFHVLRELKIYLGIEKRPLPPEPDPVGDALWGQLQLISFMSPEKQKEVVQKWADHISKDPG